MVAMVSSIFLNQWKLHILILPVIWMFKSHLIELTLPVSVDFFYIWAEISFTNCALTIVLCPVHADLFIVTFQTPHYITSYSLRWISSLVSLRWLCGRYPLMGWFGILNIGDNDEHIHQWIKKPYLKKVTLFIRDIRNEAVYIGMKKNRKINVGIRLPKCDLKDTAHC